MEINSKLKLPICLSIILLAGCSSSHRSNVTANDIINVNKQKFISLPSTSSLQLSQSTQAFDLEVNSINIENDFITMIKAEDNYFAASGRVCRKAELIGTATNYDYLICQKSPDQWVLIKPTKLN